MTIDVYIKKFSFYFSVSVAGAAALIALMPWYSDYLVNKSLQQAELGFQIEALHTAEAAGTFNPLSIQSLFVVAGAQQRVGHMVDARAALIKATELQPMNYQTWLQLAIYERDRWNEPDKAREHFDKAISLNPHDKYLKKEAGLPLE
ncbi:MAG: hypothetical protein HZB44_06415 [Actinobacteria bacterium]|nr:hypothetical protein [Actinomycetota bacterium]